MKRRLRRAAGSTGALALIASLVTGIHVELDREAHPPPDQSGVTRAVDQALGSRWRLVVELQTRAERPRLRGLDAPAHSPPQSIHAGLVRASDGSLWERR